MIFRIFYHFLSTLFHHRRGRNLRAFVILFAVLLYGAIGFWYFEREAGAPTLIDGLWFSLVTMSTVGYGDFFLKTPLVRFAVGGAADVRRHRLFRRLLFSMYSERG